MTSAQEFVYRSEKEMNGAHDLMSRDEAAHLVRRRLEAGRTYAILAAVQATIDYPGVPDGVNVADVDSRVQDRVDPLNLGPNFTPGWGPTPPPVFEPGDSIGDMVGSALAWASSDRRSPDVVATVMHELCVAIGAEVGDMAERMAAGNREKDNTTIGDLRSQVASLQNVVLAFADKYDEDNDRMCDATSGRRYRFDLVTTRRAMASRTTSTITARTTPRGSLIVTIT
jgi:hypothetical protein